MTIPKTLRRSPAAGGAAVLALSLLSSAAYAQTGGITVDLRAGNNATAVGTATFTRTTNATGEETLTVDLSVPAGIDESHVCLSAEPFSSRQPPGSCPYAQGATGTTARFVIPLGRTYVGEPMHVQASVVTDDSTAFAGWRDGNPFFGSVRIEAVIGTVEAAAGNVIGVVALGSLLSVSLLVAVARRRAATDVS